MENNQTQERIRQLVYRNLDDLFKELNELNQKSFLASKLNGGKNSKEE